MQKDNIMKKYLFLLLLLASFFTVDAQRPNYIDDIKEALLLNSDKKVEFYKSSFYRVIKENEDIRRYIDQGIIDLKKIDTIKLFQDDTTGTNGSFSVDSLLEINDFNNIEYIEEVYKDYVDQFCDRWQGILMTDFETYDNFRILRKINIISRERSAMYALHNILVSYKLHEFRDRADAIIRIFETGKVDHLNYPILEYQFKCIPKGYWGPHPQLNNKVFLPYQEEMKIFLKKIILNMEFPPKDTKTLRPYKEYVYLTYNRALFDELIDRDIERYAIEHIDYWVENDAGSWLNSIAFESENKAFKRQYIDQFLNVYLSSIDLTDSKNWLSLRNIMIQLLKEDYSLVSKKVIEYEKELRSNPDQHRKFLYHGLSLYPLTETFREAFSDDIENQRINHNLNECLYRMAKRLQDAPDAAQYIPAGERVSVRKLKTILKKYEGIEE